MTTQSTGRPRTLDGTRATTSPTVASSSWAGRKSRTGPSPGGNGASVGAAERSRRRPARPGDGQNTAVPPARNEYAVLMAWTTRVAARPSAAP